MNLVKKSEQERVAEIENKLIMTRFFNLSPMDWKLIQEGKISREHAKRIIKKSDKIVETALIEKVKQVISSEEIIKAAIRKYHPQLTANDLRLCCYIMNGMSVTDISRMRHVGISAVTAHRSRLRSKLRLLPKDDLRDYLDRLVERGLEAIL